MTLTRWSPMSGLAAVEVDRLNRMFDDFFGSEPTTSGGWTPAVDIYDTDTKDAVVKVELPGLKREDIKVTLENNVLTIEGERAFDRDVNRDRYHRLERSYGSFRRSFTLPQAVDAEHVQASYEDGVLTLTLPRRDEARPRQIPVNG